MKRSVRPIENLFDYFHDEVDAARSSLHAPIHDDTALYIVALLTDRARQDRIPQTEPTLAQLHGRAAHAPPVEQARVYRELGDRALYEVGCFRPSVDSTLVGVRYYSAMGSAAYGQVDTVMKRWFADCFGPVFFELSDRFSDLTAALHQLFMQSQDPTWLDRYVIHTHADS